jgi:hypothetical protein
MIDEHGKRHSTPERGVPPHMLEDPLNAPQKKAFAKLKKAAEKEPEKPAEKKTESAKK